MKYCKKHLLLQMECELLTKNPVQDDIWDMRSKFITSPCNIVSLFWEIITSVYCDFFRCFACVTTWYILICWGWSTRDHPLRIKFVPCVTCVRCKVFPFNGRDQTIWDRKWKFLFFKNNIQVWCVCAIVSLAYISLIGQPGFVFFFWEIVFHSRQPLCVVYLSHKKGNLYFSDQKRVTLGPLFCGVVRPTDYSPVAIKFLQKNMITMMMMIKTMMIT